MFYKDLKTPKRGIHLGHQHGSLAKITNSGGLCTYPVISSNLTESIMTQPTINYQSIAFIPIDSGYPN